MALGAALALAGLGTTSVAAGGNGALIISGVQDAYGTCADPDSGAPGYSMNGSLYNGCWVIDSFVVNPVLNGHHNFVGKGTEHFTGWIGDRYGTFWTVFTFTAKTDGAWDQGAPEIHGRCHHPITGGIGGFAGITGQISFTDINDNPPSYPYWGAIRLPDLTVSGASTRTAASTATASTAEATTC